MNYKGKIQYVRYYTAGSAACQLAPRPEKHPRRTRTPRAEAAPAPRPKLIIHPFALTGTVIALVLAVCVGFGFWQVNKVSRQHAAMEQYVAMLLEQNADLQTQYTDGYDLEDVKLTAEGLGLVPVEQVPHIKAAVTVPPELLEPTFWESLLAELRELFA